MMYILKFILLWLLPPGCMVLLLSALTFYLFKRKAAGKFAAALITLLLYFASLMPTAQLLTHGLESRYTQQSAVKADVIAVLGGGAVSGVPDVYGEGALAAAGMNRLATGMRLQRMLGVPLIVSGGKVFKDSGGEAEIAKRVLINMGVKENMVYTDTKALNTRQNAQNIIAASKENGWKRIIVVTSALHMPRAMQNFAAVKDNDMEVTAYPCDYLSSGKIVISPFSFVPQAYALDLTAMALKEYLALAAGNFL